jgi:hypothetical protein
MEDEEMRALFEALSNMNSVGERDVILEQYGVTLEDVQDNYIMNELPDSQYDMLWETTDGKAEGGVDSSMIDMDSDSFTPDYSMTAEYEGDGITSELIPGEGLVAPALAGLGLDPTTAAVIGSVATKKPGMLTNKLFAGKNLKKNQLKNRGTEGPVVQGASRTAKNTNLRPSIKNKTADRYKSMSDRVKKQNATAVAFTSLGAGLVADRMLQGNRNAQGDFITADDEIDNSNDEYDYYGNRRAITKIMNKPDGFLQRQMRKKSTSGNTEQFGQDDTGRIIKVAPETMGNQYGYHKQEGQNFWTVNNDDAYWDTHEMGTGDAWSDAEAKKAPAKELDLSAFSHWFN